MKISFLYIFGFVLYHSTHAAAIAECDDTWTAYKDEKCFKIMADKFVSQEEALEICSAEVEPSAPNIPFLLTIKSAEEQDWVTKFIFEDSQIVDNVWLGAERTSWDNNNSTQFQWADGTPLSYKNWHEGQPTEIEGHDCIVMMPMGVQGHFDRGNVGDAAVDGLWADSQCTRRSVVVCQKLQTWPLLQLQKTILEVRKHMVENPVPIGFVYVQLPSQPDASDVWPTVKWADVSGEYAGLFFRTEGGESAAFGTEQAQNAPRLRQVNFQNCQVGSAGCSYPWEITIPDSGWSSWIVAGFQSDPTYYYEAMRFNMAGGEVRPKNTAVRIWKRIE